MVADYLVSLFQQQLFDGAPHKIKVSILPNPNGKRQFQSFQATREIDVAGIALPMSVRLVGLLYFTGVLVLGMIAGLWLQRRRLQAPRSVGSRLL